MNIEVANRLVLLRKQGGYSQEDLAEKLGVSRQAISKWERAESSPDTDNLIRLAKLYGVSLDNLLSMNDELPPPEPTAEIAPPVYIQSVYPPTEKNPEPRHKSLTLRILDGVFSLIAAAIYLFIGCFWGLWHPGWLVFMLIPVYYAISGEIKHRQYSRDD
ncbi:MAG: helix-turn-helix domain-containing protein [Oscillospiraceae bacterium]|jgi:transcriptional regulator with XRE-family HTH domain|nr:helix-turn-helix domain-containing protein [Oscillospiraceae bacterium]